MVSVQCSTFAMPHHKSLRLFAYFKREVYVSSAQCSTFAMPHQEYPTLCETLQLQRCTVCNIFNFSAAVPKPQSNLHQRDADNKPGQLKMLTNGTTSKSMVRLKVAQNTAPVSKRNDLPKTVRLTQHASMTISIWTGRHITTIDPAQISRKTRISIDHKAVINHYI